MNSPTNLTDHLPHRRERQESAAPSSAGPSTGKRPASKRSNSERRFATDIFMRFAYSLLGIATLCQLALIVWLDII